MHHQPECAHLAGILHGAQRIAGGAAAASRRDVDAAAELQQAARVGSRINAAPQRQRL